MDWELRGLIGAVTSSIKTNPRESTGAIGVTVVVSIAMEKAPLAVKVTVTEDSAAFSSGVIGILSNDVCLAAWSVVF